MNYQNYTNSYQPNWQQMRQNALEQLQRIDNNILQQQNNQNLTLNNQNNMNTNNISPLYTECQPVENIEIVKTKQVDFTGKPSFYYNFKDKEIYVKKLDLNTGLPITQKYSFVENLEVIKETKIENEFVTKKDFEELKKEIFEILGGNNELTNDNASSTNVSEQNTSANATVSAQPSSNKGN